MYRGQLVPCALGCLWSIFITFDFVRATGKNGMKKSKNDIKKSEMQQPHPAAMESASCADSRSRRC